MTISSTNRKAGPFIGNGSASVFAFSFRVFAASDLEVVRIAVATGVETTLTINSAYTVSLNADQNSNPGGSITLTGGALASGYNLIITSDIANLQPTDLTNQGGFYPEVITGALDRATIQIQQLDEHVGRTLSYPITDPYVGTELPSKAIRSNKYLAFDANGAPVADTPSAFDGWVNYQTAAAASAASAASSATTASSNAVVATTQAGIATSQASTATTQAGLAATAKTAAETARDAAFVNANVYADVAAGLAAVADGVQFQVASGSELVRYLRVNSTTATEVARYPSAAAVGTSTQFETLDIEYLDSVFILDPSDYVLVILLDAATKLVISNASTTFVFETLDSTSTLHLVDANGYLAAPEAETDVVGPEIGTATSLAQRLARGLTPYGDLLLPTYMEWRLRNARMRLRRLKQGNGGRLIVAICGDSWVQSDGYWIRQFTKALQDAFGFGGLGWVGFQWFGTTSGTWVDGGTQPSGGGAGCSRTDLSGAPVFNGTWTSDNGAGGLASPSIGDASSSQAGAYVRFGFPAGHTGADLYYAGNGSGVMKYSWDGGATWSANISLTDSGPSFVALSSVPSSSGTLRIAVVSGTVRITGVNMKSTVDGVVVHKLGASGSNTSQWAAVNLTTWADQISSLGAHAVAVLLATNDASGETSAQTVATNAASIMSALASESVAIDRLWIMPPERAGASTKIPMTQYAAAVREKAVDGGFSFLDLQYAFGPSPADYASTGAFPLLDGTNVHPTSATGGALIADAVHRLISPNT